MLSRASRIVKASDLFFNDTKLCRAFSGDRDALVTFASSICEDLMSFVGLLRCNFIVLPALFLLRMAACLRRRSFRLNLLAAFKLVMAVSITSSGDSLVSTGIVTVLWIGTVGVSMTTRGDILLRVEPEPRGVSITTRGDSGLGTLRAFPPTAESPDKISFQSSS